jgi:aryl-alcohol dehydrogenase-like predicted oxidoreductase
VSSEQLAEARGIASVVSVQNRFGLDHRTPETLDVLAETTRLGIAFVPYFALAGASGERGRSAEAIAANDAVAAVAVAQGASAAQIRLAWTLHQAPNVLAIPGTGDIRHLEQNVAAAGISLTQDELSLLGNS